MLSSTCARLWSRKRQMTSSMSREKKRNASGPIVFLSSPKHILAVKRFNCAHIFTVLPLLVSFRRHLRPSRSAWNANNTLLIPFFFGCGCNFCSTCGKEPTCRCNEAMDRFITITKESMIKEADSLVNLDDIISEMLLPMVMKQFLTRRTFWIAIPSS